MSSRHAGVQQRLPPTAWPASAKDAVCPRAMFLVPDGTCAFAWRRFVVLVCGTLVYSRGDEAETRKHEAAAAADGLAGLGEEAGTPPRFAPVAVPFGGRSAAMPARPGGSMPSAPVAMRQTPTSFKVRPCSGVLPR